MARGNSNAATGLIFSCSFYVGEKKCYAKVDIPIAGVQSPRLRVRRLSRRACRRPHGRLERMLHPAFPPRVQRDHHRDPAPAGQSVREFPSAVHGGLHGRGGLHAKMLQKGRDAHVLCEQRLHGQHPIVPA